MFPESSLPDTALTPFLSAYRQPFTGRHGTREACLDGLPTGGEVRIARRQRPETMQMIRQHDDGVDRKWFVAAHGGESRAQFAAMLGQQTAAAFQQRNREKERAARHERTDVAWHVRILPRARNRRDALRFPALRDLRYKVRLQVLQRDSPHPPVRYVVERDRHFAGTPWIKIGANARTRVFRKGNFELRQRAQCLLILSGGATPHEDPDAIQQKARRVNKLIRIAADIRIIVGI